MSVISGTAIFGDIRTKLLGLNEEGYTKTEVWASVSAITPDRVAKPKVELGNTTPAKFTYVVDELSVEDALEELVNQMAKTIHEVLGDFHHHNSLVVHGQSLEHLKSVGRYELSAWVKYE